MPTGYTAPLYEGKDISFEDFVKRCAHAFIVDMRDESIGSEIPREAKQSKWESERLAKAKLELEFYQNMDDASAEQGAVERWAEDAAQAENAESKRIEMKARYESMLEKVKAWDITPDLIALRDFMIQQLESSISFDTDYEYKVPAQKTGPEYKQSQIEAAQRSVEYAQRDAEKAADRRASNQRWIDNFWNALDKAAEPVQH